MARSLVPLLGEMRKKYRDLAEGLHEVRRRASIRFDSDGSERTARAWDLLARRIDGLRADLEALDSALLDEISRLCTLRGCDPATTKVSDLASPEEADEIRAIALDLREVAANVRKEAEANARFFSERVGVIETTLAVLAEAQKGPAYGPEGYAQATTPAKGFFEGRA